MYTSGDARFSYDGIPNAGVKDQIRTHHKLATGTLLRSRGTNGAVTRCYVLGVGGGHNGVV
jgi:hypothetical protein